MNFHLLEQMYQEALDHLAKQDHKRALKLITYLARELEAEDGLRTLISIRSDKSEGEHFGALQEVLRQIRQQMDEIIQKAKQMGTYVGMIEKLEIRSIGFWKGPLEPLLPNPADFVDISWDPAERDLVVRHLRSGCRMLQMMGSSWCRLCGKRDNGAIELSDGYYLWPEGLAHYLEAHWVRLPREFVDHCRRYRSTPNENRFRQERMNAGYYLLNKEWWMGWSSKE